MDAEEHVPTAHDDEQQFEQQPQRNAQVDNAIRAIRQKKPLPEIDFTIHTMEDGAQVNTTERVCKGTLSLTLTSASSAAPSTPPPPLPLARSVQRDKARATANR